MFQRLVLVAVIPLLLGAGPCSESRTGATDAIEGEGTIHQGVGPECPQTWHIATSDGRMLWPIEDPAFQTDGLRVRYSVREVRDRASICMAGTMGSHLSVRMT